MKKFICLLLTAMILLCFSSCKSNTDDTSSAGSESSPVESGIQTNGISSGSDTLEIAGNNVSDSIGDIGQQYNKPQKTDNSATSNSTTKSVYDIKVTTFNVGNWWWGVGTGIPTSESKGMDAWKWAYDHMDSDIFGLEEAYPVMYTFEDRKILPADFFGSKYQMKSATAPIKWRNLNMYNAMLSKYDLEDFQRGYIGNLNPVCNRLYVKAYVTIGDVRVAVFTVHTSPKATDYADRIDQINEISEMLSKEDYFICFGDFNTDVTSDFKRFEDAGYNVANNGRFGKFITYYYSDVGIDNIITSSNIRMNSVEVEKYIGTSDHWPLSAYLTIVPGETKIYNKVDIDADKFTKDWFIP